MKKLLITFLFLIPILVFAQNQVTLPRPGLTPDSPFYFLDRFFETLQEFFTFNPEAKARLQVTFAGERIAEIKILLETKGVEAKGLDVAQSRLQANIARAAEILQSEKEKGRDVSQLSKDLEDEFEAREKLLEESFKEQERTLKIKEREIKAKII